ncbi:MAG: CHAT domain-containing protein [Acidobacteriota bacterium]|nr:CHAT domain-containing protein [Acidobacteriota bacterium]
MNAIEAIDEERKSFFRNSGGETVQEDLREIKPGETVGGTLKVGDKHSYKIKLEAGQSIIIPVIKNSMPMVLSNFTPNGELQSETIVPDVRMYEPLIIIAEKSGFYRINVSEVGFGGTYLIKPQFPQTTTEKDRKYLAALKLSQEIDKIGKDESLRAQQAFQKQLEKTEEKLSIYNSIGDVKLILIALKDLGSIYNGLGEFSKAFKYYKEALNLLSNINDTTDEDRVIVDINGITGLLASIAQRQGDYQKALDYRYQALNLSRSKHNISDGFFEARALHNIGVVYHLLADEQRAREFYEQSLAVNQSKHWSLQALTLINIGNLFRGIGENDLVLDYFNTKTESDRQKAIEYYKQALEVYRKAKNLHGEAFVFIKIGNSYKELRNYSEALNYLKQSLTLFKDIKNTGGQFEVLSSIGNLYLRKGEFQKSIQYYEMALPLLGKTVRARAESLNAIAKDYYASGETQKALDLHNEALALSHERAQQNVSAASLFEIARIERDLRNFANARNRIEEAIQIVESIRAKIAVQDVRATYFATVRRYYDFYTDLLMQAHKSQPEKGFDALALEMSEKSKSRSLLDLLSLASIDIKQGVDLTLLERERRTRAKLIDKAYQQNRLLLGKHTKEEAEKINGEIVSLSDEYQTIQTEIRNKSPRYAALTQPSSLNAKQIQQLLDSGTILLEYSLGEKKSYLWAVSSDSIKSFDLPAREELETQTRKVYELLTARNQQPKEETDEQRRARITAAESEYPKAAEKLSQMLLGSVAAEIGNKRLLIVPDGALNYLPFSALPAPRSQTAANQWQPLSLNHEIINLPSASVLALLREETANRKPAPKMLAVYADPVFNQTDSRLNSKTVSKTQAKTPANIKISSQSKASYNLSGSNNKSESLAINRDFERAITDVGLSSEENAGLPRLAFSRREADSIFNVSPKNLSLKAVDFKASKAEVVNSNIDQYRILHFATHGLLNSQHPELSGVVLSLVDRTGSEIDGFLRLQDIYNLKLSADLVVLSACNTALGKDVKGEGLIGLTRGFMYAGAPRLVASLWKVDDAATAELMSIFYRKMLTENLRPAAALRAAQTEMMKQTRWKSPYYWAPFVIQGEWK